MNSLGDFSTALLPIAEDLGGARRRHQHVRDRARRSSPRPDEGAHDARRQRPTTAGPALEKSLPLIKDLGVAREPGQAARRRTSRCCCARCSDEGGINNLLDVVFYLGRRDERLRPVRPLRARAARADDLHDVRDREPAQLHGELPQGLRRRDDPGAAEQHVRRRARRDERRGAGPPPRGRSPRSAARRTIKLPGTLLPGDTGVRRGAGAAPPAARAPRRGRAGPAVRPVPPRLPPRSMRRRGGAGSIAANPVLIGAVTVLVVDRRGVPRVQRELRPAVRADLRPQGRGAERRRPRQGQRRAPRRHARRHRLLHRAADAGRTARSSPCCA